VAGIRRVLVLGATGGIGMSCVETLAREGWGVVATGRRSEPLQALLARLSTPENAHALTLDLENSEGFKTAASMLPVLDGVVVASGITGVKPLRVLSEAEFQRIMRVNFEGPVLLLRELLRARKIADGGSIVFIGSIAGRIGAPGHTAYSASKAALAGFTRSLALEVASRKVRVNTVSPGLVETEMAEKMGDSMTPDQLKTYASSYPLGLGRPEDVAAAVAFLLSPASRWITATDLVVDGGVSHT
jgi:NAD(P)-dependent dehydrogenase (short-subunit alcohol dehydrogenase family)